MQYLQNIGRAFALVLQRMAGTLPAFFSKGSHEEKYLRETLFSEIQERGLPQPDEEKCVLCGTCAEYCPSASITIKSMDDKSEKGEGSDHEVLEMDLGTCIFCGLCIEVCPEKAMYFSKKSEEILRNRSAFIRIYSQKDKETAQ